ncbi:MAG: hypothetical protein IT327_14415 [Anaerolineae bacterium]|nr:hypothetical protein [Anaerolineae bacterium]
MLHFPPKRLFWLTTLLVMLLASWLYWPTIHLPLIYDTLLHIRIAGGLDFASVWLPTEAFGFYRPMTFFPMLVIKQLFDGYPPWLLHGNNVVQHAVNAGLLAWLSWRLWADWRRALAAGAIFAVFPFSYQAVAVYGHNVHPAITGLMLLGLHTYLTAVSPQKVGTQRYTEESQSVTEKGEKKSAQSVKSADKKSRRWLILTWVLLVLMVLTHETAVLFGGLAALVQLCAQPEWLRSWQQRWYDFSRQPWRWFLLAGVAYLVIYQLLPISRATVVEATDSSLWLNGLYLLQAAVFPLAWFAHLLPDVSGAALTVLSGGLVGGISAWLAWRQPTWRAPLLLAWGWWAAASLLLGMTLANFYLLRGPRLLYLGSVGVALLWAQLLAGVWTARPTLTPALSLKGEGVLRRGVVWTAVLTFILLTSGQFVRTKLTQYEQLTQPVRVSQSTDLVYLPNTEVVFVNLPQWLDMPPKTYAIGVEFVSMLGDYLFVEELTNANGIGKEAVWAAAVPELQTPAPYAYGIHAQHSWPPLADKSRLFFITDYTASGPQTRFTGFLWPLPGTYEVEDFNIGAEFDAYKLEGPTNDFALGDRPTVCDGVVTAWLIWRPRYTDIPDTTSVFVQVLDADGRLIAQADGPPLGIRPSLLAATPEWILFDLREIALDEGQTAHTLLVGVYDFASGQRSPATDNAGQPLPDNAWREPIAACGEK